MTSGGSSFETRGDASCVRRELGDIPAAAQLLLGTYFRTGLLPTLCPKKIRVSVELHVVHFQVLVLVPGWLTCQKSKGLSFSFT